MTRRKKSTASLARSSAAEHLTFVAASQRKMAQLYDVEVSTINYQLMKVFEDGELEKDPVV